MSNVFCKAFMTGHSRKSNWGEFVKTNPHEEMDALRKAYMAGYSRDYVWVEPNTWRPFPEMKNY